VDLPKEQEHDCPDLGQAEPLADGEGSSSVLCRLIEREPEHEGGA
jgi:hypothetical protein